MLHRLTDRERQVLPLMAQGRSHVPPAGDVNRRVLAILRFLHRA